MRTTSILSNDGRPKLAAMKRTKRNSRDAEYQSRCAQWYRQAIRCRTDLEAEEGGNFLTIGCVNDVFLSPSAKDYFATLWVEGSGDLAFLSLTPSIATHPFQPTLIRPHTMLPRALMVMKRHGSLESTLFVWLDPQPPFFQK